MNDDVIIEEDGSEELGEDSNDTTSKLAKVKAQLAEARKEKQEYLDGWQRAKADYVNALKRFEEEKRGAIALGKGLAAGAFLPAMDSLERAESVGEVPEAFKGIAKQLHEAAANLGLERIGVVGEKFDPSLHEALGQDPAASVDEDDTITAVLEVGWKGKEVVLRPAKVRVAHFEG